MSSIILFTGGARSGKSARAEQYAARLNQPVVYLATAETRDDEMRARIAHHQARRPSSWTTRAAIGAVAPGTVVLLDCLALLVSNLLLAKCYALAGLRLGYILAHPTLVARVAAYQPAWSVSSAAQAAGLAALADHAFLTTTVPQLWAASDALYAGVQSLGLPVWRAALPFMLVRTGDGAATRAALLQQGCVVRDCTSFGLSAWVRVAPQRPEENARLLAAWKELV